MGISATLQKVYSLAKKGFVEVLDSTHIGLRLKPILPWDNPNLARKSDIIETPTPLEELDSYSDPVFRQSIRKRENNRCFYSFQAHPVLGYF
jgi:hypothetical protein